MQGKWWVHMITLAICVAAFVCTLSFFSSQPLLPEPVFVALLALSVAMVIVSVGVSVFERLEASIQEMEERLSDAVQPRRG